MGHLRDLPKSVLGVDCEHGFERSPARKGAGGHTSRRLQKDVKGCDRVYLATDPVREGEAISWHL
jgi:DNA topoisomerase-1